MGVLETKANKKSSLPNFIFYEILFKYKYKKIDSKYF
jgi:hypothetical protein